MITLKIDALRPYKYWLPIFVATMNPVLRLITLLALPLVLSACDQLGIETPAIAAAKAEAEGKAVGGACRHAGRALEDCYSLNKKASKAAVYAGWREMDGYMRENKIDVVPPAKDEEAAPAKPAEATPAPAPEAPAEKAKPTEGSEAPAKKKVKDEEPKPARKTSALHPRAIQA